MVSTGLASLIREPGNCAWADGGHRRVGLAGAMRLVESLDVGNLLGPHRVDQRTPLPWVGLLPDVDVAFDGLLHAVLLAEERT